jgi:signal-transduction protein with cAMP-binding, CBS, and nucleotidyltransferase domain
LNRLKSLPKIVKIFKQEVTAAGWSILNVTNMAGILSEKDVVDLFYESKRAENETVNHYMTDPAVHFDENSALVNICDFLLKNIFRRVPVTSDGKLIGIISVKDVLNSILQLRQEKVSSTD